MRKFLIVHLGSFGDCLYATTIAKQIKHDYPQSHITWAISKKYSSVLKLNPHVDIVWEINIPKGNSYYDKAVWDPFMAEVNSKKQKGEFDEIVISQIPQKNWGRFDGTIRSSTLKGYAKPITVSVQPVLLLSEEEKNNVSHFAELNHLKNFKEVILFECAPGSGQSAVNVEFALTVAKSYSQQHPDYCFILSSPDRLNFTNKNIVDGSALSFRENAELTKYCTFLIGCSSGITWVSTSQAAKPLPMLQLLNYNAGIYAGLNFDFEIQKQDNSQIIELLNYDTEKVITCLNSIFTNGIKSSRNSFNEKYYPNVSHLKMVAGFMLGNRESVVSILRFAKNYVNANSSLNNPIPLNFVAFVKDILFSKIKLFLRI